MVEIICAAIAAAATIICGCIAADSKKRGKMEDKRAEQRREESHLALQMMDANTKLTIGVAMALKHGHVNGEVDAGMSAVNTASNNYVKFLERVALDEIKV